MLGARCMPRTYNHLSYEQRLRIKELLDKGTKKVDIARALSIHNATIYREIDPVSYTHLRAHET